MLTWSVKARAYGESKPVVAGIKGFSRPIRLLGGADDHLIGLQRRHGKGEGLVVRKRVGKGEKLVVDVRQTTA